MDDAKVEVRATLEAVRSFLAQEAPPRLSEADTKANFVEPIIAALGWKGIGQVIREHYVKSSGEFIDYLLSGPSGPLLAIEAKPLQSDLTEKASAQLVQYCTVEGIEWAALSNARELEFFNTFLKGDLAAKRILTLDLLAFNTVTEFDTLFQHLWRLSRASMTSPNEVRNWLNRKRLDAAMRTMLLDHHSSVVRQIRKLLAEKEIKSTPAEVTQWVHELLSAASAEPSSAKSKPGNAPNTPQPSVPVSGYRPTRSDYDGDEKQQSQLTQQQGPRTSTNYGVTIRELMATGLLEDGARLVLSKAGKDVARGLLSPAGSIIFEGKEYKSLSDKVFAHLFGYQSLNGWTSWYVERAEGRRMLADVRNEYLLSRDSSSDT